MTELKRLEISGIRSFKENPDDIDKQSIDFEGPVTLITGENGTGKTTIIESLKFATMGKCTEEMVTDPKYWGKDSIESRVSLEFKSANQNTYKVTLTPSIKKTQTNKKENKFKKGDCEVITTTPEGQTKTSLIANSKDIDTQLPIYFGVSPPIIENVIFCHQKDSCWPIDCSTRELKEKFDQIFGAEKYNGAIKALKETLKKLKDDINEQNVKVSMYNERQESYLKSEKKIIRLKKEVTGFDNDVKDKQMQFDLIDAQLNDYNKIQSTIDKINSDIQKLMGELKSDENNINLLKSKIKNLRSKEDYKSALESISGQINLKKEEQEEKNNLLRESRIKQKTLEKEKDDIKNEYETISEELNSAKSEQNFYLQKMRQFKDAYGSEDLDETLDQKREALAQADADLKSLDDSILKEKDKEIRANVINLTSQKVQMETLEKSLENNESQSSSIPDVDYEKLNEIKSEIEGAQELLDDFLKSDKNPEKLNQKIQEKTDEKEELDPKKQNLVRQKEKCEANSVYVIQLNDLEESLKSAASRVDYHLNKIREGLNDQSIEPQNVKSQFEQNCSELSNKIKALKADRSRINDNYIKISTKLQREKSDYEAKESAAEDARNRIEPVLSEFSESYQEDLDYGRSYKNALDFIENRIIKENDKLSALNNSESVFVEFKRTAEVCNEKHLHTCPLCCRDFETDADYQKFVKNVEDSIVKLPGDIKEAKLNKKNYEKNLKELKNIGNDVKTYDDFQAKKVNWSNEISKLEEESEKLSNELTEIDEQIKSNEEILENLQKLSSNVQNLVQAMSDEKKLSDKKVGLLSKIDKNLPSLEEIQNEIKIIDENIDRLTNEINSLYKDQSRFTNDKNTLVENVKILKQDYENMKNDLDIKEKLHEKIAKQREQISSFQTNIDQLEIELKELKKDYEELKSSFDQEKEEKTKIKNNAQSSYNSCNDLIKTIKQSLEKIQKLESGEKAEYHSKLKKELENKEKECKQLAEDINRYNDENTELNQSILELKEEEDDLKLLDDYYKIKERCDSSNAKLKKLEEDKSRKLGNFDGTDIKELTREHSERAHELTEAKTNKINAEEKLREEQKNAEEYAPSRKLLSEATIRLKSIELARSDIQRYMKQLDKTILEYHSQKMAEINDTIQFLWSNTYFGQDIDLIYIRCEEEKAKNAQYNYRVVMKKNGVELDMDRRCSAGQKMLASIIIRLALAQTFALNCGIIALDEPTTNLDEPNRKNLASQLIELVNAQDNFSNNKKPFQLIIITHNREFVQSLVEEGKIDCFYQITRAIDESHHCSQIQKCYETNLVIGH